MTTKEIIEKATKIADAYAQEELKDESKKKSNGSEAWQAVIVKADGRSKLAKELLTLGFHRDSYWGLVISARGLSNYFAEEAWTTAFSQYLIANGINARRTERLL